MPNVTPSVRSVRSAEPSRRDQAMVRVFELRTIPLFAELTTEELLPVAYAAEEWRLPAGRTVFREGEAADRLYVIVEGRAEVAKADRVVATPGPGECFGEMAILDGGARSATVRVVEDTRALTLAREVFEDLLDLHPAIGRGVAKVLVARLREIYER